MDLAVRTLREGRSGDVSAPLVIVEDAASVLGGPALFRKVVADLTTSVAQQRAQATSISIAALTTPPSAYATLVGPTNIQILRLLDLHSNPFLWNTHSNSEKTLTALEKQLTQHFLPTNHQQPHCCIIDDLSAVIETLGANITAALMSNIRQNQHTTSLLCFLHSDLHTAQETATVKHGITCLVSVKQPDSSGGGMNWTPSCQIQVMMRKRNGRAFSETKLCRISSAVAGQGSVSIEYKDRSSILPVINVATPAIKETTTTSTATIASSNTTVPGIQPQQPSVSALVPQLAGGMKLDLSEEERAARDSVQLPYEHQGSAKGRYATGDYRDYLPPEAGGKGGKLGHILYVRDSDSEEADSDEDPDDDLDI